MSARMLELSALLGLHSHTADPPPRMLGGGDTYNPSFDAGTTQLRLGPDLAGLVHVDVASPDRTTEDMLLANAGGPGLAPYPAQPPRTPAPAPTVTASAASSPHPNRAAFRANARSDMGLDPGDDATYARARVRRFQVVDVAALAASLTEHTPKSRTIARLEGQDGQGQPVAGWVYVESDFIVGTSTIERQVHQFVPAGMRLEPGAPLTIVAFDNPGNWDLQGLVSAKAQGGMQYARCRSWSEVVVNQAQIDAAGLPPEPPAPAGVVPWS